LQRVLQVRRLQRLDCDADRKNRAPAGGVNFLARTPVKRARRADQQRAIRNAFLLQRAGEGEIEGLQKKRLNFVLYFWVRLGHIVEQRF